MTASLVVRLKSIFSTNKLKFWFNEYTNEEKELAQMDAWQLAGVIDQSTRCNNNIQQRIVAEHLLNIRLTHIQAKASWGAGLLGFIGAIIGAVLSLTLTTVVACKSESKGANEIEIKTKSTQANNQPKKSLENSLTNPTPGSPSFAHKDAHSRGQQ